MTTAPAALPASPSHTGSRHWKYWAAVAMLVYLLLAAVEAIGGGFKAALGGQARELFEFASNPVIGLMVGLSATALIQSSSTVTSIIVGMVAGGLPVSVAIPLVMGANIGTSLTSTIVSLGHVKDGKAFKRAFAAATVHDSFNILAVAILLPLELLFRPLQSSSEWLAAMLVGGVSVDVASANFMKVLMSPATEVLHGAVGWLPNQFWSGCALIVIGVVMILLVVSTISRLLRKVMVGRAKLIMQVSVGRGPISGMLSGAAITALVQSSSTTTSLIVPLAGTGTFTLRQVYPFTVGSNIGTCITALLAATVISGPAALPALTIALAHLFFNLYGTLLIYGLPFLRNIPPAMATVLATLAQRNKLYVVAYIGGLFFALPLLLIGVTQAF